jgi:hypothetical protein
VTEAKQEKQADAKPAEGKRARRMTRVFNPIAFLQRKKADADHDSASDSHSDRGTQSRTSLRSREVNADRAQLPPELDPRIKGKGVHDFSAPRKQSTFNDYSPASPSYFFPSTPHDGSSPNDGYASDLAGAEGHQRRINHAPVFTEHLGENPDLSRRVSSLDAENLENKDFVARAAKRSSMLPLPQASATLPPFARRSQILDPMQASLYRDTDDSDAQDGKEQDSVTSSYSEVSPIIGTLDGLDGNPAFSPVSMDDRFQLISPPTKDPSSNSVSNDIPRENGNSNSGLSTEVQSNRGPSITRVSAPPSAFDTLQEPAPTRLAPSPHATATNQSALSLGSSDVSDESDGDKRTGKATEAEVDKSSGKSLRKSFKFVDKIVSAVSSSKKVDSMPKYSASNASRFSFQFGDGAAEEKALEEKHRKVAADRETQPAVANDAYEEDEYEDDYFDEDAMNDLDEMEVAQQQEDHPYGSLPPIPAAQSDHLTVNPKAAQDDATAGALGKAQSLRYLQKARQVLRDDDSLYEDDDVLGEEREVTYADHPAFRTHSAMANSVRRGSEAGPHSRQSSIQTSAGDAGDGYWRGGTIDDYMRDYALSSSGSVHSNATNGKNRKGSASSLGDRAPMPEGLPESPLIPISETVLSDLLPRNVSEFQGQGSEDSSKIEATPRPNIMKSRTISEMSFSTISDGTHHESPNAQALANLAQSQQNPSTQSPQSNYAESEGSSHPRSHGGSTLHNSMSSGQSLATSVDSSPAENKTLLKSLEARSASPMGAQGRSLHEKFSARETSGLVAGLGQRRVAKTASPAALKLTGGSQGLLSVPSSPAPAGRKGLLSDPRPNSAQSAVSGTESRALSIIEVADGDESDDELLSSHSPRVAPNVDIVGQQHIYAAPPPINDFLGPSPTMHSFPNSPTAAYSQESVRSASATSTLMTASIFGRDSLDDSRDETQHTHQHLGTPTVETIYEVNTPDLASANAPEFPHTEKPLQSPVSVKAASLSSRRLTNDSQVLPDYAKWLQLDETKRSPTTARHIGSGAGAIAAIRNFHQSQDIADMQDDMYFDDGRFEQDMLEAQAGDIVDESRFDDDSFLSRPNAAYLNTRETKGPIASTEPISVAPKEAGAIDSVAKSPVAPEDQIISVQRQASLQKYHAALADAATQAAADGRFTRAASVTTSALSESLPTNGGPDVYTHNEPFPALTLSTDQPHNFGNPALALGTQQIQAVNGAPPVGFDFGFDQTPFGTDDATDEDDDLVAAANAEALANDDDGFYGQEFQFYGRPRSNSQENEVEYLNGGYFGADGDDGLARQKSLKEPNLTPITERSEFSTRNSFINMSQVGPTSAGGYGSYSPALTLSRMPTSPLVADDVASFEQLRKLRANAFGSGEGGSPISNRSSSNSINASFNPPVPSRPTSNLANSVPLNLNTDPDLVQPAAHMGAQNLFGGFNFHDSPASPTSNDDYPFAAAHVDLDATPKKRSSGQAASLQQYIAATPKPYYAMATPMALGAGPAEIATNKTSISHSRNGSSADSITYTRGPDPDDHNRSRWFVERRRTSEQGQLELVAKDLVQGGWI